MTAPRFLTAAARLVELYLVSRYAKQAGPSAPHCATISSRMSSSFLNVRTIMS
jgi:hypothetical protein